MAIVPFYHNEECYKMYIEARKTDIKNCQEAIKIAEKRIKSKEFYFNWLKEKDIN